MEVKKNNYYNIFENSWKNVAVCLCRWQELQRQVDLSKIA